MGLLEDTAVPLTLPELDDLLKGLGGQLDSPDGTGEATVLDAPSSPQRKRDFKIERQAVSNWCWAAVAVSIADYYEKPSRLKQCSLVNTEKNRTDCCSNPDSTECNEGYFGSLDPLFQHTAHFREHKETMTFDEVKTQIAGARPIVVRIQWGTSSNGHVIVIDGYAESGSDQWLYGDDPWHGDSFVYRLADFTSSYGNNRDGNWDYSILTR